MKKTIRLKLLLLQILFYLMPVCLVCQPDTLITISEFKAPSLSPWGLAYDGENLWISDDSIGNIYKVNIDGEVLDSIHVSDCVVKGMTFKDDALWIVNDTSIGDTVIYYDTAYVFPIYCIYKIDKSTGLKLDSIRLISHSTNTPPSGFLWGIGYHNSNFYVSFNGGWGPCMFKIDLQADTTDLLCCPHPSGLTEIQGKLWGIRVNREDGAGNYVLPYDIHDDWVDEIWDSKYDIDFYATGITFDGENIWLCDRDTKMIRKMAEIRVSISLDKSANTPTFFSLHQNYPNPFNPATTIEFELPHAADVTLVIYDILGREVEKLVSGRLVSGRHEVVWNANTISTGIYFYHLTIKQNGILLHEESKKMVVLK